MFWSRRSRVRAARSKSERRLIETLESRQLLSAATEAALSPAAVNTVVDGYTPSEIRKAYGFDQITLGDGSVAADGRGQTIAIVDAYNDPNVAADLAVFNAQFGLPAANLKVVNQTGGSKLPTTDAGWAGEIALDVEWAHAIAPGASILLVEANSADTADLMQAVDYARHAAGVSVISMSWGGSEFFSWSFGTESESQLNYDPTFTTPSGHTGVTFIAAAGDTGSSNGVQWPASSPNVVAVGGTSLNTQDNAGTYISEGPWRGFRNGTSGGFSDVEPEPDYQQGAQQSGARSTPDVGYNGDPNTGFAVYDSLAYQGVSGWDVVGGTSAGAPQWAALVAIADQGRAAAGQGTLDGRTQTLPALYSVYSAPGTDGYATYTAEFHDIGDDGYGYTTGLGTPHAAAVVRTLMGSSDSNGSSNGDGSGGTGGTPAQPAQLPASPLSVAITSAASSVVEGTAGMVKLRVQNSTADLFSGPVTVTLYASADESVSASDTSIVTLSLPKMKMKAGAGKTVRLKFDYPTGLADGSYQLVAAANATDTNTADATAAAPIMLSAPSADLAVKLASPVTIDPQKAGSLTILVQNLGNTTASGALDLLLYGSADDALDAADTIVTTTANRRVKLRPGASLRVHVRYPATQGLATGAQFLIASLSSTAQPADGDSSNDAVAVAVAAG